MLKQLFSRFNRPHSEPLLLAAAEQQQCLLIRQLPHFSEPCRLQVGEGQQACLIQQGWRSPLYKSGEHRLFGGDLSALNPDAPFYLVFLNPHHDIFRNWRDDVRQLQGQYRFKVSHAERFLSHLISLSARLELAALDDWLLAQIRNIVREQDISEQDIADYPDRLALFLSQSLNSRLPAAQGMQIISLSLSPRPAAQTMTPASPQAAGQEIPAAADQGTVGRQAPQEQADAPAAPQAPEQSSDDVPPADNGAAEAEDEGPLEYYCALNGQQQGPYSRYGLQQLINCGRIHSHTLIWKPGLPSWQALQQMTEFHCHDGPKDE